jgi:hypothetical protein
VISATWLGYEACGIHGREATCIQSVMNKLNVRGCYDVMMTRHRWEGGIKVYLKEMGWVWTELGGCGLNWVGVD